MAKLYYTCCGVGHMGPLACFCTTNACLVSRKLISPSTPFSSFASTCHQQQQYHSTYIPPHDPYISISARTNGGDILHVVQTHVTGYLALDKRVELVLVLVSTAYAGRRSLHLLADKRLELELRCEGGHTSCQG